MKSSNSTTLPQTTRCSECVFTDKCLSLNSFKNFDLPLEIHEYVPDLLEEVRELNKSISTIIRPTKTEDESDDVISQLRNFSDQQGDILKRAREFNESNKAIDQPKRKRIADDINEQESKVLNTRAKFTKAAKLASDNLLISSREGLLVESFLDGLFENNGEKFPSGSSWNSRTFAGRRKRGGSEQSNLRRLLIEVYSNGPKQDEEGQSLIWCPVLGVWEDSTYMKAAHIVPAAIGVRDYAYLRGLEVNENAIYQGLYSADNAVMLSTIVEDALDKAELVIVPTEDDQDGTSYECRVISRDCSGRRMRIASTGEKLFMSDLHGKKLVWINERRPLASNFYLRYLLSRWARKRYDAADWKMDTSLIPRKEAWNGISDLRRGVLRRLAYELGDCISPTGSRSTRGASSILDEVNNNMVPEIMESTLMDTDVAIRIADRLVNCEDSDED